MLKMTRKLGETVVIGDNIEVTLVQVQQSQNQVRLGVSAPRNVGVYRKELLLAIKRENALAAASPEVQDVANSLQQFAKRTLTPQSTEDSDVRSKG